MPFDFKKEYKEYYMPKRKPVIVNIPKMNYIAVRGKGDPNEVKHTHWQAQGKRKGISRPKIQIWFYQISFSFYMVKGEYY